MPLTPKGKELLRELEKEYGQKKGREVFYAGINGGKFTGTHDTARGKRKRSYHLI